MSAGVRRITASAISVLIQPTASAAQRARGESPRRKVTAGSGGNTLRAAWQRRPVCRRGSGCGAWAGPEQAAKQAPYIAWSRPPHTNVGGAEPARVLVRRDLGHPIPAAKRLEDHLLLDRRRVLA